MPVTQHASKAGAANALHKLETMIKTEEGDCQHRKFYDERVTPIKEIRDDKRQNRCKEVAARSFEKKIWERNNKHCSSKTTPERAALKEHQNAKKRGKCIEHVAGERDQESSRRSCYCTTPPHRGTCA